MEYTKDGKKRFGFYPQQDLANDPAGQTQAGRIVDGIRLRVALGKMTNDQLLIQALMDLWNKKVPVTKTADTVSEFFALGCPVSLNKEEWSLVTALRKLVIGV